ncbi:seminal metalloprotease 1 [Papilio machaon]|uniref:seminal metalloprotease 1 n=1 Tax=Papilio machaon TaxID=76193 RepID=UPI001E6629D0|nr:seminal metalloprotease 1 [Papilio machaon]
MLKLSIVLFLVGLAACSPPVTKTREQIESFRNFLEKSRTEHGVRLSERMLANPKASAWENSGKFEGDIILDDWQVEALVQQYSGARNAYIWPGTKWPENTIVYEFGEGEFDDEQKEAIMVSIRDIEQNTCLKFRERRRGEFNYVKLTGRPDGCYANVGYWYDRGLHIMNLARSRPGQGCLTHTTIVHEWLHIIGFFHMQSTYNRDDYVRIMWDNVWPGMEHNFEHYDTNIVNNMALPYEYTSCMHYGPYGFSTNGEPTIVPIRSFEGVMGQQEYITEYDWHRTRRHYNCPGGWSKEINSDADEQKVNFVEGQEVPYDE